MNSSLAIFVISVMSVVNGLQEANPFAPSSMYLRAVNPDLSLSALQGQRLQNLASFRPSNFFNLKFLRNLNNGILKKSTEKCVRDAVYIATMAGKPFELPWAKKYGDAWGKEPSGSMRGILKWYGDFDECLSIPEQAIFGQPQEKFRPQFCHVGLIGLNDTLVAPDQNIQQSFPAFMTSICITNNCAEEDIPVIIQAILDAAKMKVNPYLTHCQHMNPTESFNASAIIAITVFSVVAGFMFVGLVVDICMRLWNLCINGCEEQGEDKKPGNLTAVDPENPPKTSFCSVLAKSVICFSPLTSFEKLVTIPVATSKFPNFSAINGIRALSLFWVMLGHLYFYFLEGVLNIGDASSMLKLATFEFVIAGYFAVDTFLFLSGFLAYWSLSRRLPSNPLKFLISLPYVYFQRLIRIAPPYYALILIDLGLWVYLWNGPFYFQGSDYNCRNNWWASLLFINNFYDSNHGCVGWTWYLAVDMQLFILVPIFVYCFVKLPSLVGWALAIAGLVANIVSSVVLTEEYHLPVNTVVPPDYFSNLKPGDQIKDYGNMYSYFYIKPYTRAGPYLVGIISCHLLIHHEKTMRKVFNNVFVHLIGWPISLATMLAIIYAPLGTMTSERVDPEWVDCIYNGVARIGWGVALSWIIMAAAFNRAGIVGQILNWNGWALPARLSYSAYLLHPLVYLFYIQTQRTPFYVNDITFTFMFCGSLVTTLMVSTIYSIAFESPIIGLTKSNAGS